MTNPNRWLLWLVSASVTLIANPAISDDSQLTCPASAIGGQPVTVNLRYENDQCTATNVRILSSVVGNVADNLAGLGIFGPVVAQSVVVVPAGTNTFCGCVNFFCQCDFGLSCSTDAECPRCEALTSTVVNQVVNTIVVPTSLSGTVATHIIISEFDRGTEVDTEIDECFVDVL